MRVSLSIQVVSQGLSFPIESTSKTEVGRKKYEWCSRLIRRNSQRRYREPRELEKKIHDHNFLPSMISEISEIEKELKDHAQRRTIFLNINNMGNAWH